MESEKGRLAEALREIDAALLAGEREFDCRMLAGAIMRRSGARDAAIDSYIRAAHSEPSPDELVGVLYELGDLYDVPSEEEAARYYFQWLRTLSPEHHDARGSVVQRLRRLTPPEPPDDVA